MTRRTAALFLAFGLLLVCLAAGRRCAAQAGEGTKLKTLPKPLTGGKVSLEEAIAKRRSVRSFRNDPLAEQELSQLLWAAQGVTDAKKGFRAVPSAGATYPLETYLVTSNGVYKYVPAKHALEEIKPGDVRKDLSGAALSQGCVREAPAVIIFAAVFERTTARYGDRGVMYVHMEAGHAAQNVHLQAVALGLASVPVGAFDEAAVASVLGGPSGVRPIYMVPVGRPR